MADLELLSQCKNDYNLLLAKYNKMMDYYEGKTDALLNYEKVDSRANNMVNNNMVQKFVGEEASYVCGNKITYTSNSNNKGAIADIELNTSHWSEKYDRELCKTALIFNKDYELYYVNGDGLFSSIILTPKDSYILDDDFGNIELCIRFFKLKFDKDTQYADVYEKDTISHYTVVGSAFVQIGGIDNNVFSGVPVGICKIGTMYESIYSNIKGSQDGYETTCSNIVNEICDFRNSYLKLTGTTIGEEDGAAETMKTSGIMELPLGGDASFLIKDLNDTFVQNTLITLKENMYELTSHINHNEKLSSNTSSLALLNRLIGLSQKCTNDVQAIQDCIKTRLKFLFEYLKIKENKNYIVSDIKIKLTPNVPADNMLTAQMLSQYPNISKKTGLSLFSFINNVDNEMEQLDKEQSENSIGASLLTNPVEEEKSTI